VRLSTSSPTRPSSLLPDDAVPRVAFCGNHDRLSCGQPFTPKKSVDGLAEPGTHSDLTVITGQGAGIIEVAPTADDVAGPGTFDVQGTVNVRHAAPDTTFTVLCRVDLNPDGVCTGATWLNLPGTPTPALTTSEGGASALHFEIARGAPFIDSVRFDVQWRLVGSDGSILESDCFTVTVQWPCTGCPRPACVPHSNRSPAVPLGTRQRRSSEHRHLIRQASGHATVSWRREIS
jgi:hypothetical protein